MKTFALPPVEARRSLTSREVARRGLALEDDREGSAVRALRTDDWRAAQRAEADYAAMAERLARQIGA